MKSTALRRSFIPLATINGLLREKCPLPPCGTPCAEPFSLLAYSSMPWLGPLTVTQSLLIGLYWLVMTVQFEVLFGRITGPGTSKKQNMTLLRGADDNINFHIPIYTIFSLIFFC
ncbi:MAG: hypothetical protein AB9919_03690 [Geobacteraceae bacterium]